MSFRHIILTVLIYPSFYINLPIGGVAIFILLFILKTSAPTKANTPWRQQVNQLDPIGTFFFITGIVCLLLALQWGGSTYHWSNARIIVLLILFALLITVFIIIQIHQKENATVPPRILKYRSVLAGMWSQFSLGSASFILIYYLPIWFQAIKNVSAYKSGIDTLPMILALVVGSISTGGLVQRLGYYTPFMIGSSIIMSIGAGLITTFTPFTPHQKWIGYQVVFGYGLGMGMQQATLGAQAVLPRKDTPTGISLIMFCLQLGGAVFVSIGQNVFSNELVKGLHGIAGISSAQVVSTGATDLRKIVSGADLQRVVNAYNGALVKVYQVALALACFSIIGALAMEWKDIRKTKKQPAGPGEVEKGNAENGDPKKGEPAVDTEDEEDNKDQMSQKKEMTTTGEEKDVR